MLSSLLAITKAKKMAFFVGCAPTSLSVGGDVGCRNILSRIKVLIITFFACSAVVGGVDCEAYKTQVLNDCTAMQTTIDTLSGRSGDIWKIHQAALSWSSHSLNIGDNSYSEYYNTIVSYCESADDKINILQSQLNAIRSTAESLECSISDGSCDCATVLGDINTKLGYVNTLLSSIAGSNHTDISDKLTQIINKLSSSSNTVDLSTLESDLSDVKDYISSMKEVLDGVYYYLDNDIIDTLDAFKWFVGWGQSGASYSFKDLYNLVSAIGYGITNAYQTAALDRYARYYRYKGYSNNDLSFSYVEPHLAFRSSTQFKSSGIKFWLYMFGNEFIQQLSSLNNYQWANYHATGVFTNLVASGFDSITNSALSGIKPYIDELDKSPLDGQTGDYFAHLTNDYLSAFSGTNPNTNYFRRIEVLLAAMLFRDNQDSDRISKLEKDIDKIKGDKESLVDAVKPDELIGNYNLGLAMFDDMPSLPTIGAGGLPDTITIEIPKWTGWKDGAGGGGSADGKLTIDLKTEKFKGFFDFLHNFFVFVYYGVVLLFVWVAFRCLMRGVLFAYNTVESLLFR